MFPFLRTFKPMLKRARGKDAAHAPSYQDVRRLLQLWMYCRHMVALLDRQNTRLYQAAQERDMLIHLRIQQNREANFFPEDTTIFHHQDG
jgi:hypothetical protein